MKTKRFYPVLLAIACLGCEKNMDNEAGNTPDFPVDVPVKLLSSQSSPGNCSPDLKGDTVYIYNSQEELTGDLACLGGQDIDWNKNSFLAVKIQRFNADSRITESFMQEISAGQYQLKVQITPSTTLNAEPLYFYMTVPKISGDASIALSVSVPDLLNAGTFQLKGTQWKLAGYVDVSTGKLTDAEPKDCDGCYTLNFNSDSLATGKSVANLILVDLGKKPFFSIGTEVYDSETGNAALFYDAIKSIDFYYQDAEGLKFFYNGKMNYLLYKQHDSDSPETAIAPPVVDAGDLLYSAGFIEVYRDVIRWENIFFVKGVAGETVSRSGKEIEIIEDLKGNFRENPSIILWGAGGDSPYSEGAENITHYAVNDTLILLMGKYSMTGDDGMTGDYYLTVMTGFSTLALSDGQVSGVINSDYTKRTMNWETLRALLDNCPQKTGFIDNGKAGIYHDGGVFFIKGKIAKEQTSGPYGVRIEPVEDLKGNFPKDLSTVLLWGAGDASGCVDKLQGYHIHKKDTVLVLMKQIDRVDDGYPTGRTAGDFTTIDCATSVLALSDGRVNTGAEYGWMEVDAFLELLTRK
ncbi:MAG: hypothetical protein LBL07_01815 [Tannerella sp.]|nr:hypothetical protein [Tannerella sp.]